MRLAIDHVTRYRYDQPLRWSTQYLRLTPSDSARQRILDWRLETPARATRTSDGYGNVLHVLTLDKPVAEIEIRAVGAAETSAGPEERSGLAALSPVLFVRPTARTRADEALARFAEAFRRRAGSLSGLRELATAVLKRMPFRPGDTDAASTAAEAFATGSGVCQDHAHVFIACCRHLGVPARYVSGYVYSAGHADGHVASHAWAEAWVVDRWQSFDVANGGPAGETHLKLAIGADYLDACPIRGVRTGGGHETMTAIASVSQQ